MIQAAADANIFGNLSRPHPEDYKIMGAKDDGGPVQLLRAAAGLFGITCRGANMTVYTKTKGGEIKIWIPQRSARLRTWPGKLDSAVAGGVRAEESPYECIIHEADEEASLPADLVRKHARPCGVITYVAESAAGSGVN